MMAMVVRQWTPRDSQSGGGGIYAVEVFLTKLWVHMVILSSE